MSIGKRFIFRDIEPGITGKEGAQPVDRMLLDVRRIKIRRRNPEYDLQVVHVPAHILEVKPGRDFTGSSVSDAVVEIQQHNVREEASRREPLAAAPLGRTLLCPPALDIRQPSARRVDPNANSAPCSPGRRIPCPLRASEACGACLGGGTGAHGHRSCVGRSGRQLPNHRLSFLARRRQPVVVRGSFGSLGRTLYTRFLSPIDAAARPASGNRRAVDCRMTTLGADVRCSVPTLWDRPALSPRDQLGKARSRWLRLGRLG